MPRHRTTGAGRRLAAVALLAVSFAGAACGDDEPVVVINWPAMNGAFQYRSLMEVDQTGLACYEHGDININHPGEASWSATGTVTMRCWLGLDEIPAPAGPLDFTNGTFGSETAKQSWPMSWTGRDGWTYTGEVYWANEKHMLARGTGTGQVELPDGSTVSRTFTWTICRRFTYQNDPVEQGCDLS